MNEKQLNTFYGNMIGNGYIPNDGSANRRFVYSKKEELLEYVQYLFDLYTPYTDGKKINLRTAKLGSTYEFKTSCCPFFTEMKKNWYYNNTKKLPDDFKLNWHIVAFWYADRGTNNIKSIYLGVHSFLKPDVLILQNQLKELGISTTLNLHGESEIIRVASENYYDFINNVKPFIEHIKCLNYKIDTIKADEIQEIKEFDKEKILNLYKSGMYTQEELGKKFGFYPKNIRRWLKNEEEKS